MARIAIVSLLGAAVFSALSGSGLEAAEQALDLPLRKAGLWEMQTETASGKSPQKQQLTVCIGAEMERKTVLASGMENRANCEKYEVKKTPDATIVDAVCTYDRRHVTTHTELSGDFQSAFHVTVKSAVSGFAPRAQGGQPVNVQTTIVQSGKYLGESCGDLQAGQAKAADGRTVIVQ